MSGQPYRYAKDVENFRNDYMESLGLRANLDDMNLQANKQFKETGSLPPKSTMKDMRTTPEILADTEKLKLSLIAELKPVCSVQMAQLVVQRVQQSPLNADGSFLVWFAQNAPELVANLKKKYKFGIAGNENDVEQMVSFLSSIFTKTKDMSQSVKSAFDRPIGSLSTGIEEGELTKLKEIFQAIQFKLVSKASEPNAPNKIQTLNLIAQIKNKFDILSQVLETDRYKKVKEVFLNTSLGASGMQQVGINYEGYQEWQEFLDKLPSGSTLRTLLDQLSKSEKNANPELSNQILFNITSVLPSIDDTLRIKSITDRIITNPLQPVYAPTVPRYFPQPPRRQPDLALQNQSQQQNVQQNLNSVAAGEPIDIVQPEVIVQSFSQLLSEVINRPIREGETSKKHYKEFIFDILPDVENEMTRKHTDKWKSIIKYDPEIMSSLLYTLTRNYDIDYLKNNPVTIDDIRQSVRLVKSSEPTEVMKGFGLKRRKGRPKGSGLVKPLAERIDHSKGIKQGHTHVPFGKYILNKNKLDSDQVYFKHNKGYNVKGFPVTKVSKNLGHVLRTIIGGGVPKFEELSGLSEQEKEYLHKIASKAGIMDKLSIPAPSKDKIEQDIHQFEVMKGELMSGNDSPEMIKKFKLLLLRLSKNGTLPKREASELMEELIQLGY